MPIARFQLYVWPDRVLMLAPAYASSRHRHHAAQIALGLDGPVVFESPETGLHVADILLIPPDALHGHPAFGPMAFLYLEPESIAWMRFTGRDESQLLPLPFNPQLRLLARSAAAADAVAAQSLVDNLVGESQNRAHHEDALVWQACTLIRGNLDRRVTLEGLSKAVHLSPSRLAHRFREATGVPLRRYVLWCRLRAAADAAMCGSSLTEAAHLGGFADSAHLTRTFRSMFGIAPSLLFEPGKADVTFCENVTRT